MDGLRFLNLSGTLITDSSVERIVSNTKLEWLRLDHTALSDDSVDCIVHLSHLRGLHLSGTRVTREGLNVLRDALPHTEISVTYIQRQKRGRSFFFWHVSALLARRNDV